MVSPMFSCQVFHDRAQTTAAPFGTYVIFTVVTVKC